MADATARRPVSRPIGSDEERLFAGALAEDEAASMAGPPSVLREAQRAVRETDDRERAARVLDVASRIPLGLESLEDFRRERELDARDAAMRLEFEQPGHPDAAPRPSTRASLPSIGGGVSEFDAFASFQERQRRMDDAVTAVQRATGAARARDVAEELEAQSALEGAFRREMLGEVGGADLIRALDAEAADLDAARRREMVADPGGVAVLRGREADRLAEEASGPAPLLPGRGAFSEDEIGLPGGGLDLSRAEGRGASRFELSLDEEAMFATPSSEMFIPERLIELMGAMRTPGRSLSARDLDFIDRFSNEDHQRALRIWELESSGLGIDQAIATALRNGAPLDFERRDENIVPLMMGLGTVDFVFDDLITAPIRTLVRQGPQALIDPVQAAREQRALDEERGGFLGLGINDSRLFTWIPDNDLLGTDLSLRDLAAGGFEASVDLSTLVGGAGTAARLARSGYRGLGDALARRGTKVVPDQGVQVPAPRRPGIAPRPPEPPRAPIRGVEPDSGWVDFLALTLDVAPEVLSTAARHLGSFVQDVTKDWATFGRFADAARASRIVSALPTNLRVIANLGIDVAKVEAQAFMLTYRSLERLMLFSEDTWSALTTAYRRASADLSAGVLPSASEAAERLRPIVNGALADSPVANAVRREVERSLAEVTKEGLEEVVAFEMDSITQRVVDFFAGGLRATHAQRQVASLLTRWAGIEADRRRERFELDRGR